MDQISCESNLGDIFKNKLLTKFQLQQWAIKSQIHDHFTALHHGKLSVQYWHSVIFKLYKLCKKNMEQEQKKSRQKRFLNNNVDSDNNDYNEFGTKKNNNNALNTQYSKYLYNSSAEVVARKRRWLSEETSRNNSVNLSTQKVFLSKQKPISRDFSLENVHTFSLKQNASERQLMRLANVTSMNSEKVVNFSKRKDTLNSEGGSNGSWVYVEERVKFVKNNQYSTIYKPLKEICKQIKEFKSYYLLNSKAQQDYFQDKAALKKSLWVSFSDEEEINQISKQNTFKINTRNLLGVISSNDWIFGLNIGNIMHLCPVKFDEIRNMVCQEDVPEKLEYELSNKNVLEKIIYLSSAYFCIATEQRFLHCKIDSVKYSKKTSEMWHAKAVHTWMWFLPKESPLSIHIHSSYIKHHLSDKIILKKKQEAHQKMEEQRLKIEAEEASKKRQQEELKHRTRHCFENKSSRNQMLLSKFFVLIS